MRGRRVLLLLHEAASQMDALEALWKPQNLFAEVLLRPGPALFFRYTWGPWESREQSCRYLDLVSVLELKEPVRQLDAELRRIQLILEKAA